ncbi:MAG: GNAT family N-acetyltransferase [Pseudomonadota bacterium]
MSAPVFTSPPPLETERLRLRAFRAEDFEAEAAFYADDRSAGVGGPKPRDEAFRTFAHFIGHWTLRGFGMWALEETSTGLYLGRAGLHAPEGWPEPEIGWVLTAPQAEGRGYAGEAARAARAWAYGTLGWTTAISLILPNNARSRRLAARLGARHEDTIPFRGLDAVEVWRHPGPDAVEDAA